MNVTWSRYFLMAMSSKRSNAQWSMARLCVVVLFALWTINAVTVGVMAQSTASPDTNSTNQTTNTTTSSASTTVSMTTSSPNGASNATTNTSTTSTGNETTTVAPGPNSTPSGAMSVNSVASLLTSVGVFAINWLLFHKTMH